MKTEQFANNYLSDPSENAIPLAPFFDNLFGDSLNSEEGVMAAITFIAQNKNEFADMLRQYIENGESAGLRKRSRSLEEIL